jgi:hypothetical protein
MTHKDRIINTVHTHFGSKRALATTRHFNSITVTGGVVTKRSRDDRKMAAEAAWFENAPPDLRRYLPRYLGRKLNDRGATLGYSIEYLPLLTLSELFVFGELSAAAWQSVLALCGGFLEAAARVPTPARWNARAAEDLYRRKTLDRVELYARASGVSLEHPWRINGAPVPSLRRIIELACKRVLASSVGVESYVHGDFCFSNILYDSGAHTIKVVDPRGLDGGGRVSAFGDARYDIAKLAHSAFGLYDLFVAGHFNVSGAGHTLDLDIPQREARCLRPVAEELSFRGRPMREWDIEPIMVLLFLSMLPLHREAPRRQRGLLANALRLYREMPA